MAEHIPLFKPGADVTYTASAAITGGQLVSVSGDRTVAPSAENDRDWVGVAATDAANGDHVAVTSGGVHELTADGAISAGSLVVPAASGAVSALAAVTTPTPDDVTNTRAVVGVALSAAADNRVLVKLER